MSNWSRQHDWMELIENYLKVATGVVIIGLSIVLVCAVAAGGWRLIMW